VSFWTPNLNRARRERPCPPTWARVEFRQPTREVAIGSGVTGISLYLPDEVDLDFVRLGSQPIGFSRDTQGVTLETFVLTPDLALAGLTAVFGLRCSGKRSSVVAALPITAVGVVRVGETGATTSFPDDVLRVQESGRYAWRFFIPSGLREHRCGDLALLEGSTFNSRLWPGRNVARDEFTGKRPVAKRLEHLVGYGAPLEVRQPYNSLGPEYAQRVVSAVSNPGLIASVQVSHDDLRIRLRHALEPGVEHTVVMWHPGEDVITRAIGYQGFAHGGYH